jgi:hypothetical protein
MRRMVLLGGLLVTGACASTASEGPTLGAGSPLTTQTVVAGAGGGAMGMNLVNSASAVGSELNGAVDAAWNALQSVYASLEIPLTFRDEAKKSLGNTAFRARRRVGPVPMIRAFDCGGDSGMPNAETYDITMEITSLLTPMPDGRTRLQTLVQGVGRRPASGGASDVRCTSIGGLEKRIADMVAQILAGK